MKLLAIETATVEVGVAVVDEQGVRATSRVRPGRLQTETLHPAIAAVMEAAGLGLDELDAVAIDIGPGLFTGLRVGVATGKALGFALGVPLASCRSTEVLVRGVVSAGRPVIAVVDMRRGEVAFELPDSAGSPSLASPVDLGDLLMSSPHLRGGIMVGDGAVRYAAELADAIAELGLVPGGDDHVAPGVTTLGQLGLERLLQGAVTDAFALQPLYLREADTKINWTTRAIEEARPARAGRAAGHGVPVAGTTAR